MFSYVATEEGNLGTLAGLNPRGTYDFSIAAVDKSGVEGKASVVTTVYTGRRDNNNNNNNRNARRHTTGIFVRRGKMGLVKNITIFFGYRMTTPQKGLSKYRFKIFTQILKKSDMTKLKALFYLSPRIITEALYKNFFQILLAVSKKE